MPLFTMQEIQAMLGLLNRTPMTSAEQLYAQGFFERLVAFCQPPPEPADQPSAAGQTAESSELPAAGPEPATS